MFKKYFSYVPLWLCIIVNAAAGLAASGPVLIALVYTFGLFSSPSAEERLIGILVFAAIILGIIGVNLIAYKLCRYKRSAPADTSDKKKIIIRIIAAVIILSVTALSFFLLPDLWLALNDRWF